MLKGVSSGISFSGELSANWGASCIGGASGICVSCSGGISSAIGIGDSIIGDEGGGLCKAGSSTVGGIGIASLTFGVPAQE
jgi:hypothetical protein